MALDEQLDGLIQRARGAEAPSARERNDVRRSLQQRLATGARDLAFEEAVLPRKAARWPRALAWGAPLVGIGVLALIVLQLAPQPVDPLVRAPQAPSLNFAPPAAIAAPTPAPTVVPAAVATSAPPTAVTPDPRARAVPAPRARELRAPDLLAESQALAHVQRALRDGQPQQALTLLAQQEREFSRGALHEERAAARALALCSAGPGAEGQRAAAAFAARYPQSVLGARVQSRCAAVPDEVRE